MKTVRPKNSTIILATLTRNIYSSNIILFKGTNNIVRLTSHWTTLLRNSNNTDMLKFVTI